jgi:aminopeptidase N
MAMKLRRRLGLLLRFLGPGAVAAQSQLAPRPNPREWSSGGILSPEQAAYDVGFYEITLRVSPADSTIGGSGAIHARVTSRLEWIVIDLDTAFAVSRVSDLTRPDGPALQFERRRFKLWIKPALPLEPGDRYAVKIDYRGRPKIAPRPPWHGGFQWARTPSGAPWIATTTVNDGADLYWPVKDHPSDKADSVALHITVPTGLVVAANGRSRGSRDNGDGTTTFDWFSSNPVSNYNVALNIAPYRTATRSYQSVTGETIPVTYWVLPENLEKGEKLIDEMLLHLRWYEERLGPYPFRADKYGVAETPHLGMEHQTIIAYGNNYRPNQFGYDELHQHELSHEWFGNLITAKDWSDYWLHEGFGSYMQPLYAETLRGREAYLTVIRQQWRGARNRRPVAERGELTAGEVYFNPPDYTSGDGDIYGKGAVVLHTLRYLLGDSLFFTTLRRWLYPSAEAEKVTDGRQVRLVSTDDFVAHVSKMAGRDLGWFFEVYVRQPKLPRLLESRSASGLTLRWDVPGGLPFPMPVEVSIDGVVQRVEMAQGRASIAAPREAKVVVDPTEWIFRDRN